MTDKIKSFIEQISTDESLKAELKTSLEGTGKEELVSNIIQFAKKHGHDLTKEDFAFDREELSPEELEAVVGGGGCGCALVGEGDGEGLFCFCVGGGVGGVDKFYHITSQGGCVCAAAGFGVTRRH